MDGVSDKLIALLRQPPTRGKEVVNVFSELRKRLSLQGERQRFASLNLFCDWVVRGRLDPEPAREFLLLLDDRLGHYDPDNSPSVDDALDPVTLSLLRDELEEFCVRLGLATTWTCDDAAWDSVVALLAEVLGNSPLKMSRKNCGFTRLRELVLSVWKPDESIVGARPGPVFGFRWECTLDDGRTFVLSRAELPADDSAQ